MRAQVLWEEGAQGPGAWKGVTLNPICLQRSPSLGEDLLWGLSGELVSVACSVSLSTSSSGECHRGREGECRGW